MEAALSEAEEKGKNRKDKKARRLAVLQRWLGVTGVKQHRDPAGSEGLVKRL